MRVDVHVPATEGTPARVVKLTVEDADGARYLLARKGEAEQVVTAEPIPAGVAAWGGAGRAAVRINQIEPTLRGVAVHCRR